MTAAQRLCRLLTDASAMPACIGRRGHAVISGAEFHQQALCWRAAFLAQPGERFALYFEDSLAFAAALLGLWHAGKTAYLPGDLTPLTLKALVPLVSGLASDATPPHASLPLIAAAQAPSLGCVPALDLQAQQLVVFTSGSTGEPEAIAKRLAQLFDEVASLEQCFGAASASAEILGTVSHQHIYGLLFRVLWPLATGRPIQARRIVYIEDLPQALAELPGAVLIASPAHLKRLPAVDLGPLLRERIAQVFSSGGPLPDEALPECLRVFDQMPIEVYGSSETGGVAWRQRGHADARVWQALPGVVWRLEGELLQIRSPHLPTLDWTDSADRACAKGSGFELLGRADRVLKIEEKRVSLQSIEAGLVATPWLREQRVLSLPGAREQLAVVAVPSDEGWALIDAQGRSALVEALRQALLGRVERVALPRRWRFVSRLPSNSQGKSTQALLLALFDARRPPARVLAQEGASATLVLQVEASLPQFEGHFPEHPVLPGVTQIEWALLFARELFELPPNFAGMEALKFQQVITPGMTLQLQLDWQPERGSLNFRLTSDKGQHASGRLLLKGAQA